MKKTKATFLTAAVLTVASAMHPELAYSVSGQPMPLYGPPEYLAAKGDVNMDGKINILDYCLLRNSAIGEGGYEQRFISDINKDGEIDKYDIFSVQDYLIGKNSSIVTYTEDNMPVVTPVTTMTTMTDAQPQPEYGCFITVIEETEPPVTTVDQTQTKITKPEESMPAITTTLTDSQPQLKYGCFPTPELDEVK